MSGLKKLLVTTAIAGVLITPAEAGYRYNPAGAIFGALIGMGLGMATRPPAYGYYPPPAYRPPPPVYRNPPPQTYAPPPQQYSQNNEEKPLAVNLICDRPQMLVGGGPSDPNPVVGVEVFYSEEHIWHIYHHFQQGGVVSRSEQYAIVDMSDNNKVQWKGTLLHDRSRVMIGELRLSQDKKELYYLEWAYWNGQLQMNSEAQCYVNNPAPQPSTYTPPPPPPQPPASQSPAASYTAVPANPPPVITATPPGKDSIPIYPDDAGKVLINVILGGQPVRMLLDTGADIAKITPSVADSLVRFGEAQWEEDSQFEMADGNTVTHHMILIHEIRIGSHVLKNIHAMVSDGDMLIGFPIINEIGPFKIDTRNRELVFNEKD